MSKFKKSADKFEFNLQLTRSMALPKAPSKSASRSEPAKRYKTLHTAGGVTEEEAWMRPSPPPGRAGGLHDRVCGWLFEGQPLRPWIGDLQFMQTWRLLQFLSLHAFLWNL